MPARFLRPCSDPRCNELHRGSGRCPKCSKAATAAVDRRRGSAHRRGYGRTWEKRRRQVLAEEPVCRLCLKAGRVVPSKHVDHIVPKSQGGTDLRENLQGLCPSCHSRKTYREDGAFGRRRKPAGQREPGQGDPGGVET